MAQSSGGPQESWATPGKHAREALVQHEALAGLRERSHPHSEALQRCDDARQRVLELSRRGRIMLDEADAELELVGDEATELHRQQNHLAELIDIERHLETFLELRARLLGSAAGPQVINLWTNKYLRAG